ncbi:MAG TPA: type 2 isopentenyl-diphosphate Delta-isomerase [bacterium]|nr:type 2 isopentenyl-diphosphate Delta-isomerase [bacterium]
MSQNKKQQHVDICLKHPVETGTNGFEAYWFEHTALPEIDLAEIATSTEFLGKAISAPLIISAITGGSDKLGAINRHLALAAQQLNLPLCVGSLKTALEHPETASSFQVRQYAPSIPLLANLGLVQLNYGYGLDECRRAVELIEADALVFHLNPLQEAISAEGDTNFKHLLSKLEKIIPQLGVPVIIKEVGFGISRPVAQKLANIGVKYIDVNGRGGTNWALVEGIRTNNPISTAFATWGIPTATCLRDCRDIHGLTLIAGGGIRTGVDIAKSLALGADYASLALPVLAAAATSEAAVVEVLTARITELRYAMFSTGEKNIHALQQSKKIHHPSDRL